MGVSGHTQHAAAQGPEGPLAPSRVLLIATDYPPLAGTNTQRVQSLVRHLPAYGWEPWVLTRAVQDLPQIDPSELAWPEATTHVIRVLDPDPFAWLARRRGRAPRELGPGGATLPSFAAPGRAAPARGGLHRAAALASTVFKSALRWGAYHPDALRLWSARAARTVMAQRVELAPAVLVTSHPAYSTHMAGLMVKRRTGLPWVADFRDLWVDRPYRELASRWHAAIDRRCEAAVLRECDHLVLASPAWVDRLASRHGEWLRAKSTVITNGYDTALRAAPLELDWPAWARLRIAFTGSMFEAESPAPLLEAVIQLHQHEPALLAGLCVRLAGYGGTHETALRERAAQAGVARHFEFMGVLPHAQALGLQASADVLALAQSADHAETIQGKLLEYLAHAKPVLALNAPQGVGAQLLRRAGMGLCVPHGDDQATGTALRRLLTEGVPVISPDYDYIAQFDRAALAGRYAALLDAVVARAPAANAEQEARA